MSVGKSKLNIINLHLDYQSIVHRENEIIKIIDWGISEAKADYHFLVGDFNCDQESSVIRFLEGKQSLNGRSAQWIDLQTFYEKTAQRRLQPTLDFMTNPRWDNSYTLSTPVSFDRILLCDNGIYPQVQRVAVFGTQPRSEFKIVPSDHYGLLVDLTLADSLSPI